MKVLGIETSCDDTGIGLYSTSSGLIAHHIYTQDVHHQFGGVIPELASRDHLSKVLPLIRKTLNEAELSFSDLGGIAYTTGPGLIGALMTGACVGRALAYSLNIPGLGVHHLEGHVLSPFLGNPSLTFPFLALLVAGGHTLLVHVKGLGDYSILGSTLDDSVGEAFDKTAKLLGLPYPGGALLAELAEDGVSGRFDFPRPLLDRPGLDFSFSGLKTSVLYATKKVDLNDASVRADIARGFEDAVVETLVKKCQRALKTTGLKTLAVAGGVGANKELRKQLNQQLSSNVSIYYAPKEFCTDNGAMIAYAGWLRLSKGQCDDLSITVNPRWQLKTLKTV